VYHVIKGVSPCFNVSLFLLVTSRWPQTCGFHSDTAAFQLNVLATQVLCHVIAGASIEGSMFLFDARRNYTPMAPRHDL
jgi:hypothetical protein